MSEVMQVGFRGLDEGADPKAQPPGTLLLAENCAMDKARRLCKRDGTTGLVKTATTGSNPAAGKRFLSRGRDTTFTNGETAWSYAPGLAKWAPIDRPPFLRAARKPLVDSTRNVEAIDVAIYQRMLVTVYQTELGVYVCVDDLDTGERLLPPEAVAVLSTNAYPRVLISGSTAYVFMSTPGAITYELVDLTTLTVGGGGTLASTGDAVAATPTFFDVAIGTPTAGVPTLYVAYELDSGVNRLRLRSYTVSTMAAITTTAVTGTGIVAVSVTFGALAQKVSVAFSVSGGTYLLTVSPTLTGAIGPNSIYGGASSHVFVVEHSATYLLAGWQRNDGSQSLTDAERLTTALYSVAAHAVDADSQRITFGLTYPSVPWSTGGRWYLAAVTFLHPYASNTNALASGSSVVVEVETSDVTLTSRTDGTHPHVGTLENQTGWYAAHGFNVKAAVDSSGIVYIPAGFRNREPDNRANQVPLGFALFRIEPSGGDTGRCATIGAGCLIASAAPAWWDGTGMMPYGFAHAPQIISVTKAAGGSIVAGDYSYVATYAWRDNNGLLHRSMPSAPVSGTTETTNLSLIVKVSTASLSNRQRWRTNVASPGIVELWRTTIGGTGPHYRLTYEPNSNLLTDVPEQADVSFTDTRADASITGSSPVVTLASREQLYTDIGELENSPPPALITCVAHRGRLVGIGPDLRTLHFSKDSTADPSLAPGFNVVLTLGFADDKTALASLDEKLVVFGEDSIDLVHGDGPDAAGQSNSWVTQGLQTDVGCVNPRSVVTAPMGVLFESSRGLEMLSRELTVSWVGKAAEDTLALFPTITSAVLVPDKHEVRWTCTAANGATGIVLAFDYLHGIWFRRKYADLADTSAASIPFVDAALIDGVYTMLTAGGQVYRETSAHKLDNGTGFVGRDIVLAPISPAGSLAWHRVKQVALLGTSVTNHDLTVSVARDYATSYEQTETYLAGSAATAIGPLEHCRITLAHQKCQAVKVRIQDVTPTTPLTYPVSTGDGFILEGLALRVGIKPGTPRTAAGQQR